MTPNQPFTLEKRPGSQYPDLQAAQRLAVVPMACDLAATIRALLTSGALVLENGRIIPNQRKDN